VASYYWPPSVPLDDTLENYIRVFELAGYVRCEDTAHEPGYERVAIYADDSGSFGHVAKQQQNGRWTSKMSWFEDIEHSTPDSLLGGALTRVAALLRRAIATT
jgi:hypothetical protein